MGWHCVMLAKKCIEVKKKTDLKWINLINISSLDVNKGAWTTDDRLLKGKTVTLLENVQHIA